MMTAVTKINAEVFFSPAQVDELLLRDKNVVVIDILRASTTIAAALNNGAREIIPVPSIESAVKISGSLFGDVTIRGGERHGKIIEGFNLGNSPTEYTEEIVKGKSIIYCTTNGSLAITKGRHAKNLVVGSFANATKVAEFIHELSEDFSILCAGQLNNFCIEDSVCAGMILNKIQQLLKNSLCIDDSASASISLYKVYSKSLLKMIEQSAHGKYLAEIGYGDDLKICASVDSIPVVPILSGNLITLKKESEKQAGQNSKSQTKSSVKK
jgi:2-phosphosulfolactate phosphatase